MLGNIVGLLNPSKFSLFSVHQSLALPLETQLSGLLNSIFFVFSMPKLGSSPLCQGFAVHISLKNLIYLFKKKEYILS